MVRSIAKPSTAKGWLYCINPLCPHFLVPNPLNHGTCVESTEQRGGDRDADDDGEDDDGGGKDDGDRHDGVDDVLSTSHPFRALSEPGSPPSVVHINLLSPPIFFL